LVRAFVFEQDTSGFAKTYRSEGSSNRRRTGSEELLGFVDVVDTFTTASNMLGVDRANDVSSGANTKNEGFLRLDGFGVLRVSLDDEMQDRLLMFMLEQAMHNER